MLRHWSRPGFSLQNGVSFWRFILESFSAPKRPPEWYPVLAPWAGYTFPGDPGGSSISAPKLNLEARRNLHYSQCCHQKTAKTGSGGGGANGPQKGYPFKMTRAGPANPGSQNMIQNHLLLDVLFGPPQASQMDSQLTPAAKMKEKEDPERISVLTPKRNQMSKPNMSKTHTKRQNKMENRTEQLPDNFNYGIRGQAREKGPSPSDGLAREEN